MTVSHEGSRLLTASRIVPIDNNTTFLCHYDITLNDVLNGIQPSGNTVATLLYSGGYFGGGVAIEEATTNLFTQPTSNAGFAIRGGGTIDNIEYLSDSVIYKYDYSQNLTYTYHGFSVPVISGSTYTLSCQAYVSLDSNISANAMVLGWEGSGGGGYAYYDYTKKGTWQNLLLTSTVTGTTTNLYIYPTTSTTPATLGNLLIKNLQFENKSFKTSFVNGSRVNGFLAYNDPHIINKSEGAISLWLYPRSLNGENPVFTNGHTEGDNQAFDLLLGNDAPNGTFYYRRYSPKGGTQLSYSMVTPITRQWTHIACSWKDGGMLKLYINGVLVSSVSGCHMSDFIGHFALGSTFRSNPNIIVDEVRVDSIERTPEEIMSWYLCGSPFYPKGIYRLSY